METAELIEEILLYCPLTTIVAGRRVCRRLKETVRCSRRIRQALFLEPATSETLQWNDPNGGNTSNSLSGCWKTGDTDTERIPVVNPFILRYASSL